MARRFTRRRAVWVGLLLLTGAALTCLTAWGAALFLVEPGLVSSGRAYEYADERDNPQRCLWLRTWSTRYGCDLQVKLAGRFFPNEPFPLPQRRDLPLWSQVRAAWPLRPAACDDAVARRYTWMETAYGWPCPSFVAAAAHDRNDGSVISGTLQGGLAIQGYRFPPPPPWFPRWTPRVLPLRIWAPGFLADTFLYAAVLGLIGVGWRWWRGRARRRRGLCPVCGYDVRASPERCPECGRPVASPSAAPATGDRQDS